MCDVGVVGVVFCLSIMYGTGLLGVCQFLGGVVFVMWGVCFSRVVRFLFLVYGGCVRCRQGAAVVLAVLDDLEFCYGFCFCLWLCCFSCWAGGS